MPRYKLRISKHLEVTGLVKDMRESAFIFGMTYQFRRSVESLLIKVKQLKTAIFVVYRPGNSNPMGSKK